MEHLPIEEGETPCPSKVGDKKGGEFNPNFMYGAYIEYSVDEECPKAAIDWVNEDAASFIPYDYMDKVEIIHKNKVVLPEGKLSTYNSIGWKYTPEVMETPLGNEMADLIDKRLYPCRQGCISYKKNGYRYSIKKIKATDE